MILIDEFTAALISIITAGITAGITTSVSYLVYRSKLRHEFKRDIGNVRTQYQAEAVALRLLDDPRWKQRSFKQIRHHLGGFDDDELRRILVRTGAIRFGTEGDNELWGLITRNLDKIQDDSNNQSKTGAPFT